MRIGEKRRLRRDPLAYLDNLSRRSTTGLIQLPWGGWCVSDPVLAQTLLRSPEYHAGKSGFFGDLLPTRSAQVEVGHAVRNLLRAGMPHYRAALTRAVAELPTASRWPAAGTRLLYRCLADLLLHPGTPAETRKLLQRSAYGGVAVHAPHVWQRARAEVLRARLLAAVTEQVGRRRKNPVGEQRDVLDAVLSACPAGTPDRTVAELHLMMFRAIMSPLSTSLAWTVLLACLHHTAPTPWPWPADHVVREALRHRPVAWMVGRTLPRPLDFGGTTLPPGVLLSVSPYLLHHDEHLWSAPQAFQPERWATTREHGPYVPFGMGPFICAGAAVAHTLLAESLTALCDSARLTVTGGDPRPVMAESTVPRPFTLHRALTSPTTT
ncbi:cytochrome P450 [Streptomyces sp. NPDC017940]|uniref:cytochrome P450 n=1 Tax=Streptomyces sp. NPDC017940 TaxID=3365017 RepID=UPI0037A89E74